jgi:hypothetical protein
VLARADFSSSLIGSLVQTVDRSLLLRNGALPLAKYEEIETSVLREWLALGKSAQNDIVLSLAIDMADSTRVLFNLANDPNFDAARGLKVSNGFIRTEELFEHARRYREAAFIVFPYAIQERPAMTSREALATAMERFNHTGVLTIGNFRDVLQGRWEWAALEMRILERELGPLEQHRKEVEAALKTWTELSAEWKDGELQLWDRSGLWGTEPKHPLITLEPLR